VIRVAAWDTHQDRQWQIEQAHMRRQAAKRNAKAAGAYMDKFGEYVGDHLTSLVGLEPKDIAALARIAHQIETHALEPPGPIGLPSGHGGHQSTSKLVNAGAVHDLSDEDRRARMLMLRRELDRRLEEHDLPEGHTDPDLEAS
jgi:hypothetical protein